MQTNECQQLEQLAQKAVPRCVLRRFWHLGGGMSATMTALETEDCDNQIRRMIVRQPGEDSIHRNPNVALHEYKILQLTHALGLTTQTPYYVDQHGLYLGKPCLLIEYIDGSPQFSPLNVHNYVTQMARCLARIHSVDTASHDVSFLKQVSGFAEVAGKRQMGGNLSWEIDRIWSSLSEDWTATRQIASVLLHGDYWPGNILWRDNELVAVIDWEDAKLGDPLSDFAISRLEVLVLFGLEAMQTYSAQYQSLMSIDYADLPKWDLCAALRLARLVGSNLKEWCAYFQQIGRADITEQVFQEHYRYFVTQALEKIEGQAKSGSV